MDTPLPGQLSWEKLLPTLADCSTCSQMAAALKELGESVDDHLWPWFDGGGVMICGWVWDTVARFYGCKAERTGGHCPECQRGFRLDGNDRAGSYQLELQVHRPSAQGG